MSLAHLLCLQGFVSVLVPLHLDQIIEVFIVQDLAVVSAPFVRGRLSGQLSLQIRSALSEPCGPSALVRLRVVLLLLFSWILSPRLRAAASGVKGGTHLGRRLLHLLLGLGLGLGLGRAGRLRRD